MSAARRPLAAAALALLCASAAAAQQRSPAPKIPDAPRLFPLRILWTMDLPAEPSGAPVADRRHVYLPLRSGEIVALDRGDGWPRWMVEVEAAWQLVADGALIFAATGDGVVALDAADGAESWRAPVGALAAAPVARAGWLVVGTEQGDVLALRAGDGSIVWRRALGSPVTAAPAIQGDILYLPLADRRIAALQVLDGRAVWERTLGGRPAGVLALPDRVYVGASDNFLYCLSAGDGRVDWRWRTAADVTAAPVADEARVYFVSLDNVLRALDRRSGVQRWRSPMPSRLFGSLQVAANRVLASMPTGRLPFYAAATGRLIENLELPAVLVAAPSAVELSQAGGGLVVATVDSSGAVQLHAIGPGDDPQLAPPQGAPGLAVDPEVPLASAVLPLVLTAPPGLPTRGG